MHRYAKAPDGTLRESEGVPRPELGFCGRHTARNSIQHRRLRTRARPPNLPCVNHRRRCPNFRQHSPKSVDPDLLASSLTPSLSPFPHCVRRWTTAGGSRAASPSAVRQGEISFSIPVLRSSPSKGANWASLHSLPHRFTDGRSLGRLLRPPSDDGRRPFVRRRLPTQVDHGVQLPALLRGR